MVFWTASSSLCTVNLSLLTAARAEARFASRVAELMLELEEDELGLVSLVSRSLPLSFVACSPVVVVVVGAVVGVVVFLLGDLLIGVVVVDVGVVAGVVVGVGGVVEAPGVVG